MIDYKWTAESICMASPVLARDVIAAVEHAEQVPGDNLTPSLVDRLRRLADALTEELS
jgi:hypothetical protein